MKISTIKWLKKQYKNTKIKNLSNKDNVRFYYKKRKNNKQNQNKSENNSRRE